MLVELGVVEERYRAGLEVLDEGVPVTVVARRYGVARQTVHEWLSRYANEGGLAGLADRSSRPVSCPHQMTPVVEARIIALRREHPGVGAVVVVVVGTTGARCWSMWRWCSPTAVRRSWHVLADPEGNEFWLLRRRVDPV